MNSIKAAQQLLGVSEWIVRPAGDRAAIAGPFPDSWQLKETRKRAETLLDEMGAS